MRTAPNPTGRIEPQVALGRLRDDRGQTIVEFAFAAAVFFITVFGTIEFGRGVWQYNMMADLAQQGARWAAVHGRTGITQASAADLQLFVQSRSPGLTVIATADPVNPGTKGTGEFIEVTVSSTFSPLTTLIPATTMTLSSTARMTVFR